MSRRATEPRLRFGELETTARVLDALRPRSHRAAGGLWGGSAALLLACLAERRGAPVLAIAADDEAAADLHGDLASFAAAPVLLLAGQELDGEHRPEPISLGQRVEVLQALPEGPFVLVAGLRALIDPVPRARALHRGRLELRTGMALPPQRLVERAAAAGLRRVPVVLAPGEWSQRGDVIDVYPLGSPHALRLELFDDALESIRRFDPASQRSLAVLESAELLLGTGIELDGHVLEHLGRRDLLAVRHEPLRLDEARQSVLMQREDAAVRLQLVTDTIAGLTALDVSSLPSHDLDFKVLSAGSAVGSGEADPVGRLRSIRGLKGEVHILCRTEEERDRLDEIFRHKQVSLAQEHVTLSVGSLSRGFRIPELSLTVISNVEFAGVPQPARVRERTAVPTVAVQSFFELGPGDLVVHAVHGIALFEGVERVSRGESEEDHLRLQFQDEVRLLVPVSKIHLVQKYVGAGEARPKLDRLGGRGFAKRCEDVQAALFDLASDLLELQARRERIERQP
jgi:transcription-repair coupling factor (superfamily II helicase)